jgi:hypothetical protein
MEVLRQAFDWELPAVQSQICRNFCRIMGKNPSVVTNLVENGVFELIWTSFCSFPCGDSMDLLSDAFLAEDVWENVSKLVEYGAVVSIVSEIAAGFWAGDDGDEGEMLASGFSLVTQVVMQNGYDDVLARFLENFWEFGHVFYGDATSEQKQFVSFFVMVVFEEAPLEILRPGFEMFRCGVLEYVLGDDLEVVRGKCWTAIRELLGKAVMAGDEEVVALFRDAILPFLGEMRQESEDVGLLMEQVLAFVEPNREMCLM